MQVVESNSNVSFKSLGVGKLCFVEFCFLIFLLEADVLCEAVKKLNWDSPTAIQEQAIPVALEGKDVIGLAATGSGKTGAFALPILQALLNDPMPYFALILAPTHELAFQIGEQFEALGTVIGLRTCIIIGAVDMMQQALSLAKKPHIIIATPGRILQHLESTKVIWFFCFSLFFEFLLQRVSR